MVKMFVIKHVVVVLSVFACVVSAAPVGLFPPIQRAASSLDAANFNRWLLQFFTQRSFIDWQGRTHGVNFQPGGTAYRGGTSDLYAGGTSYPFLTGRLEEGDDSKVPPSELNVVRDYTPPTKTTDVQKPTVQRDFQAEDIVFPQTIKPKDRPRLQIPVLSLQESGRLVDDSTRPSSETIPNDLIVVRDRLTENTDDPLKNSNRVSFAHSRLSDSGQPTANINVHTATHSPISENFVERNENNLDPLQENTIAQVSMVTDIRGDTPDIDVSNLPIERDREGAPASRNIPSDLVIIRDSVANEDSGHIITTRAMPETGTAVSTKTVENGIIVLLPFGR